MKEVIIIGAGGLGKEILALVRSLDNVTPTGFYDDGMPAGSMVNGLEVIGGLNELKSIDHMVHAVIAIGDPVTKRKIASQFNGIENLRFIQLIHPKAIIMDPDTVKIGEGTVIAAGAILTSNISIGSHVLVNINATIGHDCTVENFASIMPASNLSGNVTVGPAVLVGTGASIINAVTLGEGSKTGMGAVVLDDVAPWDVVVGVPAKSYRS